jgi:pimeloyl-ACP methyl ester carboxylesterase
MVLSLGLHMIMPERTGYGETAYDATMTPVKYANDWVDLMSHLGYSTFKVMTASGGGPYADHLATMYPSQVKGLHLISAVATTGSIPVCPLASPSSFLGTFQFLMDDPSLVTLLLGPNDQNLFASVPGFSDWFIEELATAADPASHTDIGIAHDYYTFCNFPVTSFSAATFPTFIYHGELDALVPISQAEDHALQYPNVMAFRRYPNGEHLTMVRHLGQILLDVAGIRKTILCHGGQNTLLVGANAAMAHLAHGDSPDICAWAGTPAEDQ